jgi:hypothetical protein
MTVGRIPNVEGGIQPTLLTTAGDIMYASSASNPARLGIGTAGQVLTVNSGATAPEWAAPASPTWTTYTPTNVGITVGNGTQIARFSEIGKIVCVSYKFTLGSTSSVTGSVSVGLPSTNNSVASCSVLISDTGTGRFACMGRADTSAGNVLIRPVKTDATYGGWSDTLGGMFTWASTDFIEFSITYEKV